KMSQVSREGGENLERRTHAAPPGRPRTRSGKARGPGLATSLCWLEKFPHPARPPPRPAPAAWRNHRRSGASACPKSSSSSGEDRRKQLCYERAYPCSVSRLRPLRRVYPSCVVLLCLSLWHRKAHIT